MNDYEWEKIEEKYGRLMMMIAHRIGGDQIANSFEDSTQELTISCMDALRCFKKKTTKTFDEFFETKEFDKYIKTCLWNRKNNNGSKIKKKLGVTRGVSLKEEMLNDKAFDASAVAADVSAFADYDLDDECFEVVRLILSDGQMIKPNGRLNINRLCKQTNKPKQKIRFIVERLQQTYKDYNNE